MHAIDRVTERPAGRDSDSCSYCRYERYQRRLRVSYCRLQCRTLAQKGIQNISQGSVATRLRCGGIFNEDFVTNLLLSLMSKNVNNQSALGDVTGKITQGVLQNRDGDV